MEARIPDSEDEKLQISSANWIEGTTRSCNMGVSHLFVKAKIRSATNKLKSKGERVPSAVPNLMQEEALAYIFSISWQNLGPRPEETIFLNNRGWHTLSYAFCRSMKAAYSGWPI